MPMKEILEPSVPPRIGSQIGVIPAFSIAALATLTHSMLSLMISYIL